MDKKRFIAYAFIFLTTVLFSSYVKAAERIDKRVGLNIPLEAKAIKLAEIIENPAVYHGKKLLLEGVFAGACPSLCDFTYREGAKSITVYPQDFKLPKIKKGQRIKIYAEITAGKERVVISALGMEVIK